MKNFPTYALQSVDHALQAAVLLQQEGPQRVVDVAERLGIAPSTAHRLLRMLVFREFANQQADRRYSAGTVLRTVEPVDPSTGLLRRVAEPHMRWLMERAHETVTLVVPVGGEARFVATVECEQVIRVTDRTGFITALHAVAGGRAMLAAMAPEQVAGLYADDEGVDVRRLLRELARVRRQGFAINDQRSEKGLTALGVAILDSAGAPWGAIALAMPTPRFRAEAVRVWVSSLLTARARIDHDLGTATSLGPR